MLIVADENIPFVREAFSSLGEVRTMPGRAMTAELVRDATLLLVRSVTDVGPRLLEGTRVAFVGTATIGYDHVDLGYLSGRGTGFAAAPGCNATSVAEYVATALLVLESRGRLDLGKSTLGVVGVGNVGSRVARIAHGLGLRTLLNDPPRARAEGAAEFVDLCTVCAEADAITFHVPLCRDGPDPTWHLINEALLGCLRPAVVVLNTSRGGVHDTLALKAAKRTGKLGGLVLDVFEDEPAIDPELATLADLATPHIAGYSYDGKVAGTRMILQAACQHFGQKARWPDGVPPAEDLVFQLDSPEPLRAVLAAYDIEADDTRLRQTVRTGSREVRGREFDRLRKEYPRRREFGQWRVRLARRAAGVGEYLAGLGFRVERLAAPAP
jgi:erythronate-4-phosphate dehydrogenase